MYSRHNPAGEEETGSLSNLVPLSTNANVQSASRTWRQPRHMVPLTARSPAGNQLTGPSREPDEADFDDDDDIATTGAVVGALLEAGLMPIARADKATRALESGSLLAAIHETLGSIQAGIPTVGVGELGDDTAPILQSATSILRDLLASRPDLQEKVQGPLQAILASFGETAPRIPARRSGPSARKLPTIDPQNYRDEDGTTSVIGFGPQVGFVNENAAGAHMQRGGFRDMIDTDGHSRRF